MKIGDRIQLGDELQMRHSWVPQRYAYAFATITDILQTNSVECKIDTDGQVLFVRAGDFTIINNITMPQKEDLLGFLND